MDYDVIILGGGIIGCAIAYEMSKYSLNIALIEREYDIASDVADINTAIIYDGVESDSDLMADLEHKGNLALEEITSKFKVPFNRCGSYIIAQNEKQEELIKKLYDRSIKRGIEGIEIVSGNNIIANVNVPLKKALYSPNTAVIAPYDLALSFAEVAFDNGVNFKLEEEVLDVQKISKGYKISTNKNKFTCKTVINTTPIVDKKQKNEENNVKILNNIVINKDIEDPIDKILICLNEKGEAISKIKSPEGHTIISAESTKSIDFHNMKDMVGGLINKKEEESVRSLFHYNYYKTPINIDNKVMEKGFIRISGKNYAEVTMTPAIAKNVCDILVEKLNAKLKTEFIDRRREIFRFKELDNDEKNQIIKIDSRYGNIVCGCETITEGEIVDAIRRPLGARTIDGVKRRTSALAGDCNGAYCFDKILSILARETNKSVSEIVKNSKSSYVIKGRIKEFNEL